MMGIANSLAAKVVIGNDVNLTCIFYNHGHSLGPLFQLIHGVKIIVTFIPTCTIAEPIGIIAPVQSNISHAPCHAGRRAHGPYEQGLVNVVWAPLSGQIEEVNQELETNVHLIDTDPFGEGWLFKIIPFNLEAELAYLKRCKKGSLGR